MSNILTIMFHTVGLYNHEWFCPHISEPIVSFENKIKSLKKLGYESIFFKDIEKADTAKKYVSLTFDDGYLDNWVHVFPILQKYGMKGTIFVSPEFVDPYDGVRNKQEAVISEKQHNAQNCCAGFLSWQEMRKMEKSGLVDIQAHALSHTWYFAGPRVVDFWHPGSATEQNGHVWMLWNKFPEFKPHYLTRAKEYEHKIDYGTPIYEHGKALVTKKYFPDLALETVLTETVKTSGGQAFFDSPDWRKKLLSAVDAFNQKQGSEACSGTFETDSQYTERMTNELTESKRSIEANLNKQVNSICWPGGGISDEIISAARDAGYTHFTLPSAWYAAQAQGKYAELIKRMGAGTVIRWRNKNIGMRTNTEFEWRIKAFNGSGFHKTLLRIGTAIRLVRFFLGLK